MTKPEQLLWHKVRRKQIHGIQFYRQKPLLQFIVDFYAPAAGLVIEVDGVQHLEPTHLAKDQERDQLLAGIGLTVLRFSNQQIFQSLDAVIGDVENEVAKRLSF